MTVQQFFPCLASFNGDSLLRILQRSVSENSLREAVCLGIEEIRNILLKPLRFQRFLI